MAGGIASGAYTHDDDDDEDGVAANRTSAHPLPSQLIGHTAYIFDIGLCFHG